MPRSLSAFVEGFLCRKLPAQLLHLLIDLRGLDLDLPALALLRKQRVDDELVECAAHDLVAAIGRDRLSGPLLDAVDHPLEVRLLDVFAVDACDDFRQLLRNRLGRRRGRRAGRAGRPAVAGLGDAWACAMGWSPRELRSACRLRVPFGRRSG